MKIIWFVSGLIFLASFWIISPVMKIMHWAGSDLAFLISGFFGLVFIPLTLYNFFKKIR